MQMIFSSGALRPPAMGIAVAFGFLLLTVSSATAFQPPAEVEQYFGRIEFEREWVPAASLTLFDGQDPPASTSIWDGLGPLYNETRCATCHQGPAIAGRFAPSAGDRLTAVGLVVRLGDAQGRPDPFYGEQIQTRAIGNLSPEGLVDIRMPQGGADDYELSLDLLAGDLAPGIVQAPIAAPSLIGRGAIQAVDPAAIEALAAEQASRGDGIAGVVHHVATADGEAIGLYGYKAEHPDLLDQVSHSFLIEMGISSRLQPFDHGECTMQQSDCLDAPISDTTLRGGFEVTDREIETIMAYLGGLAAPAQANPDHETDPEFLNLGCARCHVPSVPARDGGEVVLYSDLLLHDMGAGFDNGIGAHGLSPSMWRTAPLLELAPYPGRRYLHDGRAATLDVAIRAHGGEAEPSRLAYEALGPETRQRLLDFLESL